MPTILALILFIAAPALAKPPHWQNTLDQDLQGPRVEWAGEIVSRIDDNGYTCFVLDRAGLDESKYIACNPGYFAFDDFAPGSWLKATGNLGARVPREIGGKVLDYPLIAGALIAKSSPQYDRYYDPYHFGRHPYYHHPFYDPFYGPYFGPRFGTGFFFHFR